MDYYGYKVNPSFVDADKGIIKWVITGNGEYFIGKKGGKTFFVKRNIHVRYPDSSLPKSAYDLYKADADKLEGKQKKLKKLMGSLSWDKSHIVVEEDNFWDSDKKFVTVTACVPDALPDDYDFSVLSTDEYIGLALDFAKRLDLLHSRGVIHGDLKEKNVLVKENAGGYETYLIDFDTSYAADSIPGWESIGGTDGYQSPEVMLYGSDEGAAEPSTITYATDIFTTALIMHRWWTGLFPETDPEAHGKIGAAVYFDKSVEIDKKFDVKIGPACGATLMSLINWMLAKDPQKRPTAKQVISVLSDEIAIPDEFHKGKDDKPFDTSLWSIHVLAISLLSVDELKALGVKSFKRINGGKGYIGLKYKVVLNDGTEKSMSADDLVDAGYAKRLDAEIEEPWPEHEIEFEPADVISSKGYARIRKALQAYNKRYIITMQSGLEFDKGYAWLLSEGLAHAKKLDAAVDVDLDTPWPEHGTQYVVENMARLHIIGISRVDIAGEHRYKLVYDVMIDGKQKINDRVPVNNMKLMGLIK